MILHNLFPTPVAKFEFGRDFTAEEQAFVSAQSSHRNIGNATSNNSYVLRDDTFSSIADFVQKCANEYLKSIYAPKENVQLRITQSWLNYSKPNEFHHKHAHPNSFVSGVLYMKAVKDRDRIYFWNDAYRQIDLPTENFNAYNSKSWWLPVSTGDLMMFPSSLAHSVEPVQEDERISLAFNTFPVGLVGGEDVLTALHL